MDINTNVKLNNGVEMPMFGYGTYLVHDIQPFLWAFEEGYRLLDTAANYANEEVVGTAIRKSGLSREEVFVTTKMDSRDMNNPRKALEKSLERLGMDYVDLYLIHSPVCPDPQMRVEAWKVFEQLYKEGKCKGIGVSNFTIRHLKELIENTDIVPMVNQVEFHIHLYDKELLNFCNSNNIVLEGYMPLTRNRADLEDDVLGKIAKNHSKTISQVMIRWVLQHGVPTIPKSSNRERIKENAAIFDFELTDEEMSILNSLDKSKHYCSADPTGVP